MKKILVPSDFSEQADNALEVAFNIAKKAKAEIVLLNVVEDTTVSSVQFTGELDFSNMENKLFVVRMIQKAKEEIGSRQSKYSDVKIDAQIRIGNPYHNIKDYVLDNQVDLVVMGTTGSTGLAEFLVGSNAEKVVRYAECPVLTIHKKAASVDFKNIVYATSVSGDKNYCINILKAFELIYDSKIHIVRINTPNNFESDRLALPALEKVGKSCGFNNYDVQVYNDVTEEEGIIHFAESIKADMIAMVTHGRTGLAHFLTGSIAEDVVNHAKRPVLTHVIQK